MLTIGGSGIGAPQALCTPNQPDANLGYLCCSWGESWGENGFFRVKRGVNSCSMASSSAGYPKM